MAANTAAYDEVLKTIWGPGIAELIPTKTPLYDRFVERDAKDWGGRYVEYPAVVGRTQGVASVAEGGALPTAGQEKYQSFRIPMTLTYARVQFTGFAMKASEGDRNAFASIVDREMKGVIATLRSESARMIFGDGRGVLCLLNGDPGTTTTATVDSPGGVAGATNGARYINPGMLIAAINPSTGTMRSGVSTVNTVGAAGTTFTTTSAINTAWADNDYLVRAATTSVTDVSDTSYIKEPMGLLGHVDDGTYVSTYHNINRTSYPILQSSVISSVGAISADVIQRAIDLVDQIADGDTSELWCHHSVRRAMIQVTDDRRRYMGSDLSSPDMGTRAAKGQPISFGGIPVNVEKYAPYGMVFGLDPSPFYRYVLVRGAWADDDGSVLARSGVGTSGVDTWEAFYRIFHEFHCDEPAKQFRLADVAATVTVAHIH